MFLTGVLLASCVKDDPPQTNSTKPPNSPGNVYIVCEGGYGFGNGSLFDWKPTSDSVYGDLYSSANGGSTLGDVFQSMTRIGNKLFLCVNNSNVVRVLDATTCKLISTISVPQPRYIADAGNGTAFVTALYGTSVYRINTQTCSMLDSISVGNHSPEGICLLNDLVYVACWDTGNSLVSVLDVGSGALLRKIRAAGAAPQEVLPDKDGMLWVLSGNAPDGKSAFLSRIDPSTGAILDSFAFPPTANPVRPVFNPSKDTLYFIGANYKGLATNNGIYRMSIYDHSLPESPLVAAGSFSYFWALGIDPITRHIFAGDPKGFTQNGVVIVFDPSGRKLDSFKVGIGPGHFYFDY